MSNRVVPLSPARAPSTYRQLVARCTARCDSATVAFDPVWAPSIWRSIPSMARRARRQGRIRTFLSSPAARPSIKQATKTVAALLFALRRVPGGRRHVPQRGRALLCAYYRALVAILLFGAPEDGGDRGALGRRTAGDGASCRSTQAGEMRDREESRDERPEIFFILQYNP